MSHPTADDHDPALRRDPDGEAGAATAPPAFEVEEMTPAGSPTRPAPDPDRDASPRPDYVPATPGVEDRPVVEMLPDPPTAPVKSRSRSAAEIAVEPPALVVDPEPVVLEIAEADDEEVPELVWYVLKVQSSREDTIRDALERRVKIQGLGRYFGRIVVPTEKITELRNNKKRVVERKTYPGYIMVQMELNEKTWFTVRETPGVGDFVGAHGTPSKMSEAEVNQMLHTQDDKPEGEAPKIVIEVARGDRVKIKDGPFENFEGTVEEVIEARGLVKVMLIIFNRPTPVDLEYWQVEPL